MATGVSSARCTRHICLDIRADILRRTLKYANWNTDCANDWREFQLSQLRPYGSTKGYSGSPWDNHKHNTYRLASNGQQNEDIKQYHILMTITGKNKNEVEAKIWHQWDKQEVTLAQSQKRQVNPGDAFELGGNVANMPKRLRITRITAAEAAKAVTQATQRGNTLNPTGQDYKFEYASPADGPRFFSFKTWDYGNGTGAWEGRTLPRDGGLVHESYCKQCPKGSGIEITCSFPGW
jgi:hypothetical protein